MSYFAEAIGQASKKPEIKFEKIEQTVKDGILNFNIALAFDQAKAKAAFERLQKLMASKKPNYKYGATALVRKMRDGG